MKIFVHFYDMEIDGLYSTLDAAKSAALAAEKFIRPGTVVMDWCGSEHELESGQHCIWPMELDEAPQYGSVVFP